MILWCHCSCLDSPESVNVEIVLTAKDLHQVQEWLAIIIGGIEVGRYDLAKEAAWKLSRRLALIAPAEEWRAAHASTA